MRGGNLFGRLAAAWWALIACPKRYKRNVSRLAAAWLAIVGRRKLERGRMVELELTELRLSVLRELNAAGGIGPTELAARVAIATGRPAAVETIAAILADFVSMRVVMRPRYGVYFVTDMGQMVYAAAIATPLFDERSDDENS